MADYLQLCQTLYTHSVHSLRQEKMDEQSSLDLSHIASQYSRTERHISRGGETVVCRFLRLELVNKFVVLIVTRFVFKLLLL